MKKGVTSRGWIFHTILIIIIIIGFSFLIYLNYNTKKIISAQTGMMTEQKIKIQSLEGKLSELENKEIEIISKLNILQSMSNLSRIDKQCELSGLKIIKADYYSGKLDVKIENSNNVELEGVNLKAYLGDKIILNEKLDGIAAFGSEEFLISTEKPDEIVIVPKILIDGDMHVCEKEVRSSVSELVDINGRFNVTSYLIVNGENKEINLIVNFVQTGTDVSGTASARKSDGSLGQPFKISGNVNNKILNLGATKVELPADSISGIGVDLLIDITLEGIVENNNKIEGSDMGDVVIKVKDFPAQGVSISIEGMFSGERI